LQSYLEHLKWTTEIVLLFVNKTSEGMHVHLETCIYYDNSDSKHESWK